jgi:hypothetical protein
MMELLKNDCRDRGSQLPGVQELNRRTGSHSLSRAQQDHQPFIHELILGHLSSSFVSCYKNLSAGGAGAGWRAIKQSGPILGQYQLEDIMVNAARESWSPLSLLLDQCAEELAAMALNIPGGGLYGRIPAHVDRLYGQETVSKSCLTGWYGTSQQLGPRFSFRQITII